MFDVTAQPAVDDESSESESESESDSSIDSDEQLWLDEHAGVLSLLAQHGTAVGEKRKKAQQEATEADWNRVLRSRPESSTSGPASAGRDCARLFSPPR